MEKIDIGDFTKKINENVALRLLESEIFDTNEKIEESEIIDDNPFEEKKVYSVNAKKTRGVNYIIKLMAMYKENKILELSSLLDETQMKQFKLENGIASNKRLYYLLSTDLTTDNKDVSMGLKLNAAKKTSGDAGNLSLCFASPYIDPNILKDNIKVLTEDQYSLLSQSKLKVIYEHNGTYYYDDYDTENLQKNIDKGYIPQRFVIEGLNYNQMTLFYIKTIYNQVKNTYVALMKEEDLLANYLEEKFGSLPFEKWPERYTKQFSKRELDKKGRNYIILSKATIKNLGIKSLSTKGLGAANKYYFSYSRNKQTIFNIVEKYPYFGALDKNKNIVFDNLTSFIPIVSRELEEKKDGSIQYININFLDIFNYKMHKQILPKITDKAEEQLLFSGMITDYFEMPKKIEKAIIDNETLIKYEYTPEENEIIDLLNAEENKILTILNDKNQPGNKIVKFHSKKELGITIHYYDRNANLTVTKRENTNGDLAAFRIFDSKIKRFEREKMSTLLFLYRLIDNIKSQKDANEINAVDNVKDINIYFETPIRAKDNKSGIGFADLMITYTKNGLNYLQVFEMKSAIISEKEVLTQINGYNFDEIPEIKNCETMYDIFNSNRNYISEEGIYDPKPFLSQMSSNNKSSLGKDEGKSIIGVNIRSTNPKSIKEAADLIFTKEIDYMVVGDTVQVTTLNEKERKNNIRRRAL